jgi:hypothetical protein
MIALVAGEATVHAKEILLDLVQRSAHQLHRQFQIYVYQTQMRRNQVELSALKLRESYAINKVGERRYRVVRERVEPVLDCFRTSKFAVPIVRFDEGEGQAGLRV